MDADTGTTKDKRDVPRWLMVVLMTVLVIAVVLGALHGAAELDENVRPTQSANESGGKDLFVVEVEEAPRPIIVIECDEGFNGDANARFREFLGVEGPPISIPGGPLILSKLPAELSEEHGALARSAIEIIKRYAPERVILIAHSECLLYDVGGAYAGQPGMVPLAQRVDLVNAAKLVKSWLPKTKVEIYYALKEGGRVKFNPVPLQQAEEVR